MIAIFSFLFHREIQSKIKDVLKDLETKEGIKPTEDEVIKMCGCLPPIEKMDATLLTLKNCTQLSLSTNNIEKIGNLSGLCS